MKKLTLFISIILYSCQEEVINKSQYQIVDTLDVSKNGVGYIFGYDVIIKYDSAYHYGYIDTDGKLLKVSFKKLKFTAQ